MQDLSNIAYIVPNLNRYEINREEFWLWWDKVSSTIDLQDQLTASRKLEVYGVRKRYGHSSLWDGVTIWKNPNFDESTVFWKLNYNPNDILFGDIIKRIHDEVYFYDIDHITLWSNIVAISPHKDGSVNPPVTFPSEVRIELINDATNNTFYLTNDERIIVPDLNTGPNLFIFNNTEFKHGAYQCQGGRKILIRIDGRLKVDECEAYVHWQLANNALSISV